MTDYGQFNTDSVNHLIIERDSLAKRVEELEEKLKSAGKTFDEAALVVPELRRLEDLLATAYERPHEFILIARIFDEAKEIAERRAGLAT